jgi:tol-pal system protein YbgF
MRQGSLIGIRMLVGMALVLLWAGCDTFSYVPLKSKAVIPSETTAPGTQAPGEQAAAPAATQPRPTLDQQVQALEARVQQLEARLAELEQPQPAAGPKAPGAPGYPKVTAASASDKSYSEGLRLYQGKKYGPARDKFHQYLKEQPQGPRAAEARYYLADSFYAEGKYKEGAVEFNKMATQFPKSILAPAALLRQAYSYQQLKQTQNYQATLKKLAKTYPNSPEAKEAQKQLKEGAR